MQLAGRTKGCEAKLEEFPCDAAEKEANNKIVDREWETEFFNVYKPRTCCLQNTDSTTTLSLTHPIPLQLHTMTKKKHNDKSHLHEFRFKDNNCKMLF